MAGVELYPPESYPHILLEYADYEFGFGEYWEAFCLARQAWKVEVDPNTRKKISFYVDTYAIHLNAKENDINTILFLEPNQSSPEEVTAQFKKLMSDIHLQNISSVAVPGARKLMEKAYREIMEKLSNNHPVSKRKRDDEPKCNCACKCKRLNGSELRTETLLRSSAPTLELKTMLDKVVTSNKVVLFMKGIKDFLQCGFSHTLVQILNSLNVPFEMINIQENELLRQELKEYSGWPTFPQLYIDG